MTNQQLATALDSAIRKLKKHLDSVEMVEAGELVESVRNLLRERVDCTCADERGYHVVACEKFKAGQV